MLDVITITPYTFSFSYAGKKGGLNDTRGTLFFELARAVKEIQPKVFMGENVKGLLSHDDGRTLDIIRNAINRELKRGGQIYFE